MDRPTVLVIDYEPRNLAATVEPLTAAGYRVEVARDGVAGLDAFRRLQPHVVFMEAMLPKKHAFEVCQEIRRARPGKQTRVFILGAPTIAQSQQSKAVHQYGADRFLPRPVDGPTLVALCSSVLPGPDAPNVPEIDLLKPLPAARASSEAEILSALEKATPRPPGERFDLSVMSEDDIMAQLDQLLPSVQPSSAAARPAVTPAPPAAPAPVPAPVPVKPPARVAATPARVPAPAPTRAAAPAAVPLAKPQAVAPAKPQAVPLAKPQTVPLQQPVPVPVPPAMPRPVPSEAARAPVPPPARSRVPVVAALAVLAAAGVGSWMLFRPGAAPVAAPAPSAPFVEQAPASLAAKPEAPPAPDVEAPALAAESLGPALPQLHVKTAPPPAVSAKPTAQLSPPAPKPSPSIAAAASTTEALSPAPKVVEPAPPPVADQRGEAGAEAPRATEIPLPIAPPRLEPLPVGSDAARPRISPDVFRVETQPGALLELAEVDRAPVPVSRPAPVYPLSARQMRREGEIGLRLLVDAEGQVASVELVTGSPKSDLAAAAIRAARTWRYRPAMKDGVPVQVRIVEKIAFKL